MVYSESLSKISRPAKYSGHFYLLFTQEHLYPLKFKPHLVWKSMPFYNGMAEYSRGIERFANTDSFEAKLIKLLHMGDVVQLQLL